MIPVTVSGPYVEAEHGSYVVLLNEQNGKRSLPIWIGPTEAYAIAYELAGVKSKRPLTHDLATQILQQLDARVSKVAVSRLVEKVFYAELFLEADSMVLKIDARPSDSIILALKMGAPIFVAEEVMGKLKGDAAISQEAENLRARLQRIRPEDFGDFAL
jgi:hypothetical protein